MNIFLPPTNNGMMLMVIATSLCNRYDEWKTDANIMNIVDLDNNSICVGLKTIYPSIETKVIQSIALAFTMYFVILIQDNLQKTNNEIIDEITLSDYDYSIE